MLVTTKAVVWRSLLIFMVHPEVLFGNQPRNDACQDNRDEFGFALVGYDYETIQADNFGRCFFQCSLDKKCQSATFLWSTKECKMKKETKKSKPADFVENPAASYMENPFRGLTIFLLKTLNRRVSSFEKVK